MLWASSINGFIAIGSWRKGAPTIPSKFTNHDAPAFWWLPGVCLRTLLLEITYSNCCSLCHRTPVCRLQLLDFCAWNAFDLSIVCCLTTVCCLTNGIHINVQGQAVDIRIHAEEMRRMANRLYEIYAKHTGQPADVIGMSTHNACRFQRSLPSGRALI